MRLWTLLAIAVSLSLTGCGWNYPNSQYTGKYEGHGHGSGPYSQTNGAGNDELVYNLELLSTGDCLFSVYYRAPVGGNIAAGQWRWQPLEGFDPCRWDVLDDGRLEFKLGPFERIYFARPHESNLDYFQPYWQQTPVVHLQHVSEFEHLH